MGLNILVYKLSERETVEDIIGNYSFIPTEKYEDWDGLRYSGDREFATSSLFDYIQEDERDLNSPVYNRPKDFAETRKWVNEHIYEGGRGRYHRILDAMESDKSLYFFFSW